MSDKKPGGSMPKQTGAGQKGPAQPGGSDAKPVTPNKGFEKKPK